MNQLLCIGDPSQNVMAESKGSLIAKSVSKHAGRAKEKVRNTQRQSVTIAPRVRFDIGGRGFFFPFIIFDARAHASVSSNTVTTAVVPSCTRSAASPNRFGATAVNGVQTSLLAASRCARPVRFVWVTNEYVFLLRPRVLVKM